MIYQSLGESAGHFWKPVEFENVANPDFGDLKHLQNPGHLLLTKASSCWKKLLRITFIVNNCCSYENIILNVSY